LNRSFETTLTLSKGIEWVGWGLVTFSIIGGLVLLNTENSPNDLIAPTALAAMALGTALGLGIVVMAQLTQAQIVTATNSSKILKHLQKQIPIQSDHAKQPSPTSSIPAEGRLLRSFKGFVLRKYDDGISVDGKGRYPNILAAEKRATELAAETKNS